MRQIGWKKWLLLLLVNGLFTGLAFPLGFLVLVLVLGFMSSPKPGEQILGVLIAVIYLAAWALVNRTILRFRAPEQDPRLLWGKALGLIAAAGVIAALGVAVYEAGEEWWQNYTFPWHAAVRQLRRERPPNGFEFLDHETDNQLKSPGGEFVLYMRKDTAAAASDFSLLREWGARSGLGVDGVKLTVKQRDPNLPPEQQTYVYQVYFAGAQVTDCYPTSHPICTTLTGRTWQRDLGSLRDYVHRTRALQGLAPEWERSAGETARADDGLVHLYLHETLELNPRQLEQFLSTLDFARPYGDKTVTPYLVQISRDAGGEPDLVFRYQASRGAARGWQQVAWVRCRTRSFCSEVSIP